TSKAVLKRTVAKAGIFLYHKQSCRWKSGQQNHKASCLTVTQSVSSSTSLEYTSSSAFPNASFFCLQLKTFTTFWEGFQLQLFMKYDERSTHDGLIRNNWRWEGTMSSLTDCATTITWSNREQRDSRDHISNH
ncbi:mCG144975, partial [Mus musculus]